MTQATAAEWFVRVQNDDLSAEDIAEWQQWMSASGGHRAAFEKMQSLWHGMERLPGKTPPTAPKRLRHLALAAALGAILLTGGLLGGYLWQTLRDGTPAGTLVFETGTGEHREALLPDGSRLSLGARSLVWIRFGEQQRRVTLDRGEAYFTVAPESARPFVVHAGTATVTAVGTSFNVRKSGDRVRVAVTEGKVKVVPLTGSTTTPEAAQSTELDAGHQLTIEPFSDTSRLRPTTAQTATAWRSGRLEYIGEPLKYVVADINRYSERPIIIADPQVGELLLTGTVFEDSIEVWLRSVEALLPVSVREEEAGRILLERKAP